MATSTLTQLLNYDYYIVKQICLYVNIIKKDVSVLVVYQTVMHLTLVGAATVLVINSVVNTILLIITYLQPHGKQFLKTESQFVLILSESKLRSRVCYFLFKIRESY